MINLETFLFYLTTFMLFIGLFFGMVGLYELRKKGKI